MASEPLTLDHMRRLRTMETDLLSQGNREAVSALLRAYTDAMTDNGFLRARVEADRVEGHADAVQFRDALTALTAERDDAYLREERMYRQLEDARHELQEVTAERDQLRFALQLTKTVLLDVERTWAGSDEQYTRLMDAFAVINSALEGTGEEAAHG